MPFAIVLITEVISLISGLGKSRGDIHSPCKTFIFKEMFFST